MLLLFLYSIFGILVIPTLAHIPNYVTTPSNKVEQFCLLAETCFHDTIPICGKFNEETRPFLDFCDLLEYACDTNQIFMHIEDVEGCPEATTLAPTE